MEAVSQENLLFHTIISFSQYILQVWEGGAGLFDNQPGEDLNKEDNFVSNIMQVLQSKIKSKGNTNNFQIRDLQ